MTGDELSALVAERLAALQSDFAAGERDLARLDEQREILRVALLRISGAIQALTELSSVSAGRPATAPALIDVNAGDRASSA
jgi:hypothetical protein